VIFDMLARRFHEISTSNGTNPQYIVGIRVNIIKMIETWVRSPHVKVDAHVLSQLKTYASSIDSSTVMMELANGVLKAIEEKTKVNEDSQSLISSTGGNIPASRPRDLTPRGLAIALSTLAGNQHSRIRPTDYIDHLKEPPSLNRVSEAYTTNKQIMTWVKRSVLQPTQFEGRAGVFIFFVNTAYECRKLGNFQSTDAIVNALTSSSIQRLEMTQKEVMDKARPVVSILRNLEQLLKPDGRLYKAALKSADTCIPLLDVHLSELKNVFRPGDVEVNIDGRRLINFSQCICFRDWMRHLKFEPPDPADAEVGALAYLETQLQSIRDGTDESLDNRSLLLEKDEKRIKDLRLREFRNLGFA